MLRCNAMPETNAPTHTSRNWLVAAWGVGLMAGAIILGAELRLRLNQTGRLMVAPATAVPPARTIHAHVQAFADLVNRTLGPDARAYLRSENGHDFEGHFALHLFYRGGRAVGVDDAVWTTLEQGTPEQITAALAEAKVTHVMIQTAQPRSRVLELCVHSAPLVRSDLVRVDAQISYTLEVYAIDTCRSPR